MRKKKSKVLIHLDFYLSAARRGYKPPELYRMMNLSRSEIEELENCLKLRKLMED